jgi:hypothetical protein
MFVTLGGVAAAEDAGLADAVRKVCEAGKQGAWFWGPPFDGVADIPYTYEHLIQRRILNRRGREVSPPSNAGGLEGWRSVRLERIALDWGSHFRCLMQDGKSPCSQEWIAELERQHARRSSLTAEDKARIDRSREARRERVRAFWTGLADSFVFERVSASELRFHPRLAYRPEPQSSPLLGRIAGRLWYDPATHEPTRLEYEVVGETGDGALPKGMRVEVRLIRIAEGRYVPGRYFVGRPLSKGGLFEERTTECSNYRRFSSESDVRFR